MESYEGHRVKWLIDKQGLFLARRRKVHITSRWA